MTPASIGAAYNARAAEYAELAGDVEQMNAADRSLIAQWRDATPGRLLDAGCGPGLWTDFLDGENRNVIGLDISEELLAAAHSRHPHLRLEQGSFYALPVADASLGGILAWYSLIHTPPVELPAVLEEFARAVAPGGSLLIGFFDGPSRQPFAHAVTEAYFWSAEALSDLLASAGFTVSHQERRERAPDEVSIRPHGALIATRH